MLTNILLSVGAVLPVFLLAFALHGWWSENQPRLLTFGGGFFLYLSVLGSFLLMQAHFGNIGALGDLGLNLPTLLVGAFGLGGLVGAVLGATRLPVHWGWRVLTTASLLVLVPVLALFGWWSTVVADATVSTDWRAGPYAAWQADSTLKVQEVCPDHENGPVIDTVLTSSPSHVPSACNLRSGGRVPLQLASSPPDSFAMPERLFVLGDTHGRFDQAVTMLRRHDIVDDNLKWKWGSGHLVFLGDAMDKGTQVDRLLWFIYRLQQEARAAGGQVTFVLGNHERLVLSGHLNDDWQESKYFLAAHYLDTTYDTLFSSNTVRGRWIRSRNAVVRIGPFLLAHGGLHPKVTNQYPSLETINREIRAEIDKPSDSTDATFLYGQKGPLWYRGYFQEYPAGSETKRDTLIYRKATESELEGLLGRYGAERIIVSHTTVPKVHTRYKGRVVAVDVEFPRDDAWFADPKRSGMSLLVKDGRLLRAHFDGSTTPVTSQSGSEPDRRAELKIERILPIWAPSSLREGPL